MTLSTIRIYTYKSDSHLLNPNDFNVLLYLSFYLNADCLRLYRLFTTKKTYLLETSSPSGRYI